MNTSATSRSRVNRTHRRICRTTGKVRFRDHKHAVEALRGAARCRTRAERDGVPTRRREVRAYLCEWCDGWHTTSMSNPPAGAPV